MAKTSNKGFRCPSHWTLAQRLDHYTDKSGGPAACWPWVGRLNWKGYGVLRWNGKDQGAHRLAWQDANGEIPQGLIVCHACDNPPCRNEAHLFLGTDADNAADRDAKGRGGGPKRIGALNGAAKLNDAQVREIRASTESMRALSRRYNVSRPVIRAVIRGETWAHVF